MLLTLRACFSSHAFPRQAAIGSTSQSYCIKEQYRKSVLHTREAS